MAKQPNQQRYRCTYCRKSWLATAYDYMTHVRVCQLGPHATHHPGEATARHTGAYRGWKLFEAPRARKNARPAHWRADAHGVTLTDRTLPGLLVLIDIRFGNKLRPRVVS